MRVYFVGSGINNYSRAIDHLVADAFEKEGHEVRRARIFELLSLWHTAANATGAGGVMDEESLERALGWLYEEVREFRPHLFLAMYGCNVPRSLVAAAKKAGAACVLWATDDPYAIDLSLEYACRGYDLVFTVEKAAVPEYERVGVTAHYLPLACCPEFHRPVPAPRRYRSEALFIGTGFPGRVDLLEGLAEALPHRKLKVLGTGWKGLNMPNADVEERLVGPAEGVRWACGAGVVLNPHRGKDELVAGNAKSVPAESPNPRLFEVAACGAYQVCDARPGVVELGVPVYSLVEDLAEKVERALKYPEEAKEEAGELRRFVLENHTYRHRVREIVRLAEKKEAVFVEAKSPAYYENVNPFILEAIPPDARRVLDVGCGAGALGAALKERLSGLEVTGVEINPLVVRKAAAVLDAVIAADVEAGELPFEMDFFDCVICGDVLEHLRDPWATVRKLVKHLKPGGAFVASLPNVCYVNVVENLLKGEWNYEEAGVLDATHLRFFTKKSAVEMFEKTGLTVEKVQGVLWSEADRRKAEEMREKCGLTPEAMYAQYLLVAKKKGEV